MPRPCYRTTTKSAWLGNLTAATAAGSEVRFSANLPVGQGVRRVDEYVRDFDAGLRGLFSAGFGITELTFVGRREGTPMFDAAWVLTEVSDTPKPADVNAKADRATASWVSEEALASVRSVAGFGDVNIHPQGRVPKWDPLDDLDLGNYARVLLDPRQARRARREVAWMERNLGQGYHVGMPDGAPMIPFALLARCGPAARARADARAKAGVSPEQHLERYMSMAETALQELVYQESMNGGVRTLTQANTSAGALSGIMVDVAHSIMWLTEMDDALDMMTVVTGLMSGWQSFYGNAAPSVQWPGEGTTSPSRLPPCCACSASPRRWGYILPSAPRPSPAPTRT